MDTLFRLCVFTAATAVCWQAAASESVGARVYADSCAVCHGADGTGNGPYAELLTVALPDLTQLRAQNDGDFPFERVYKVIDGRDELAAHGPRDMPVWGAAFDAEAIEKYLPFPGSTDPEIFVNGRILSLITHLQSIQD